MSRWVLFCQHIIRNTISNYKSNDMNKRKHWAICSFRLLLFPSFSSGYCNNALLLQTGGTVPLLGSGLFKTNTGKMKLQTGSKEISWVRSSVLLSRQLNLKKGYLPIHMDIRLHYRKQSSGKRAIRQKIHAFSIADTHIAITLFLTKTVQRLIFNLFFCVVITIGIHIEVFCRGTNLTWKTWLLLSSMCCA